jgi:hypothetical protein
MKMIIIMMIMIMMIVIMTIMIMMMMIAMMMVMITMMKNMMIMIMIKEVTTDNYVISMYSNCSTLSKQCSPAYCSVISKYIPPKYLQIRVLHNTAYIDDDVYLKKITTMAQNLIHKLAKGISRRVNT